MAETDPIRDLAYSVATVARAVDQAHDDISRRLDRLVEYVLALSHDQQTIPILTADRIERAMSECSRRHAQAVPVPVMDEPSQRALAARIVADVTGQIARPASEDAIKVTISKRLLSSLALKLFLAAGGGAVLARLVSVLWP